MVSIMAATPASTLNFNVASPVAVSGQRPSTERLPQE
jgi:hypothetical protein